MDRLATWWAILVRPSWWWLLVSPWGPLAVLGRFQAIRNEFLSDEWVDQLRILVYFGVIPWWLWIVSGLIIAILIILESALRVIRSHNVALDVSIEGLSYSAIPNEKKTFFELTVTITNKSPEHPLGIRKAWLEISRQNLDVPKCYKVVGILPHLGRLELSGGKELTGTIGRTFHIEPADSLHGTLVFVDDFRETDRKYEVAELVLRDYLGLQHRYEVSPKHVQW